MRNAVYFFTLVAPFLLTGGTIAADAPLNARATIINLAGTAIGTAQLSQAGDGVTIQLAVNGLAPGTHGFHIHENGVCAPPDFKSAGGHFNPLHKQHGISNPRGSHAGDLPNLEAAADGSVKTTAVARNVTLAQGPAFLLKPGGTSIVIHAGADDNKSDPAGNSGARIACGVIEEVR